MLENAKIFRKESSRPLTKYQKQVNEEAGLLALSNPSLLCRCGELLELAQEKVMEGGYDFVKGKSRSKRLASPDDTPRPSRVKINAELRQKGISALEEDIANLDQQIGFKEKRRQQSENVRNYKLCEEIAHEIGIVKQQRRQLAEELNQYREKERKAKWYQRSKGKAQKRRRSGSSAGTATSDEGEFPLSSPSTSEVVTRDSIEIESEDDTEPVIDNSDESVFPSGLPVNSQLAA